MLEQEERGHVPLQIDGAARACLLDTGTNYSGLIRSEVERLGLEIRPAGLEVETSTDATVTADVGDSLRIDGVLLSDVVLLVLPDGQDVLEALGGYTVDFRNMAFTLE